MGALFFYGLCMTLLGRDALIAYWAGWFGAIFDFHSGK